MHAASGKREFRSDVQGLRGVAVLLVLFYHAGFLGFRGGYIGVDIFYVISGFLITGLLLREIERTGGLRFADFYARRARRLAPAAAVVLVATTGVAWMVYSPLELKQFTSSAIATAVYLSNFWFAHLSTDYLAEGTDADPLLHTWSLGVEEQFYLVWPLLLFVIARSGPADSLRGRLLYCFGGVAAVSFLANLWLTHASQPWAFFGSPTRAWEFAAGGVIALWNPSTSLPGRLTAKALGIAGLLLILGGVAFITDRTPFPGAAALLPVAGAAFVIASGHFSPASFTVGLLRARPLTFVGDISYSLYLWHWPVFVFLELEFPGIGWSLGIIGLSISLLLSWLTYGLVENPARFSPALVGRAYVSIAVSILLLAASVGLATAARGTAISVLATDSHQRYLAASEDSPSIYANGCHADIFVVEPPDCSFGGAGSSTTLVLFGDSHAAQWLPALRLLAEREGWRVVLMTKSGCASMSYSVVLKALGRIYSECDEWRERAFRRIGALRPAVTILANSSMHPVRGKEEGGGLDRAGWDKATRRTLSELAGSSAAVAIIRDTPRLGFSAPTCLSRAVWRNLDPDRACPVGPDSKIAESVFEIESRAAAGADRAFMVDMTDAICPGTPCSVERNGFVLYRDSHHLTVSFVEHLAQALYQRLKPIIDRARTVQRTGGRAVDTR